MKKTFFLFCILCVALTGCSVSPTATTSGGLNASDAEQATTLTDVACLYYPDAEPDPVLSANLTNRKLVDAVYLPLVTFDETLDVTGGCAASHTVNGRTLRFTLDAERKFSDGSAVTGEAVAACFERAMKNKSSPYHAGLSGVESVSGSGLTVTVTFKEETPGALYACCLPVAKAAENGKFVGCGNYVFGRKNGRDALLPSEYAKTDPAVDTIYLLEPKETSELSGMFNSGVLDILPTDLLEDNTFSASRNYDIASCLNNEMIYLGVSAENALNTAARRRAFGRLIPRDDIVKNVLMGLGKATARPFYPSWNALSEEALSYGEEKIIDAFTDAGWKNASGKLTYADGQKIALSLLVAEDDPVTADAAERIKAAATSRGISLSIESEPRGSFDSRLLRGDFDLFLRRQQMRTDLDPGALLTSDGAQNYGGVASGTLDKAYKAWRTGQIDAAAFCEAFEKETPFIPVAYTAQTVYLTKGLRHDMKMSFLCPLGDLSSWIAQ